MALVIEKPVDLASLGEAYKGITLIFRTIPAKDIVEIDEKNSALEKDEGGNPKPGDAIPIFIDILQKYFVKGKQNGTEVTKEDVAELDSEALIHCFEVLTGQALDPKDKSQSETPSTTEPTTQK